MFCSNCGYRVTAVGEDCPLCGKSAQTERSTEARLSSPHGVSSPSPLRPSSPRFFNDELWPVVGFVLVAGLFLAYTSYARDRWECQVDSQRQQASAAVTASAVLEVAGLRREGFRECNAGNEQGCCYYVTKMREYGHCNAGQSLQARMIVAQFLANHPRLVRDRKRLRDNLLNTDRFQELASVAADEGDCKTMDAALLLAVAPTPEGLPPVPVADAGHAVPAATP